MIYLLIAYAQMSLMGGCAQEVLLILGGARQRHTEGMMGDRWAAGRGRGQKAWQEDHRSTGWAWAQRSAWSSCRCAGSFSHLFLSLHSSRDPWEPFFTTHFQRPPMLLPHAERAVFGRGCGGRVRMESGCNKLNGVEKETERPRRDICGHPGPAPLLYLEPSLHIPGALRCGKAIKRLSKLLYEEKRKQRGALICSTFLCDCWFCEGLFISVLYELDTLSFTLFKQGLCQIHNWRTHFVSVNLHYICYHTGSSIRMKGSGIYWNLKFKQVMQSRKLRTQLLFFKYDEMY